MLLFIGNDFRDERGTEPFIQKLDHLIAWPSAQRIEEIFRHLSAVLFNGVCPGAVVQWHRVGQRAVAVKDVSCIPLFGWCKYCHSASPGILARVQRDHNWFREKRYLAEF